ncbi:hypothetical protein S83_045383 [Arachis hypogaea]|nr:uncharacterized protein DS421_13g437960 [Arachis hypogaea]
MGFIMEFAKHLILKMMEDPEQRDRKFREHVYAVKERCAKTKEMWSIPMRPYGFWTFDRHNSQLAWDAQIAKVPGRMEPYEELLPYFLGTREDSNHDRVRQGMQRQGKKTSRDMVEKKNREASRQAGGRDADGSNGGR